MNPEASPIQHAGAHPIALDGLAYGIDQLDAILVFHLGDAHLHASWVRPDTGLKPDDTVGSLRDAYRVCQFASRRLSIQTSGTPERRGELLNPLVTLELPLRSALLRRVRSYVVACLFDASLPIGMARLISSRLTGAIEPELPLGGSGGGPESTAAPHPPKPAELDAPSPAARPAPKPALYEAPSRLTPDQSRVGRLLAYLEAHAPEPHIVRLRLALRAGITLAALDRPETLGPEALVLIEASAEDILGVGSAELRRLV